MQAQSTPQRKYALTKIAAGDYLLPSNDAQTIWRITAYTDGPSNGLEIPKDRKFWGLWRWDSACYASRSGVVDPDDWEQWGDGRRPLRHPRGSD